MIRIKVSKQTVCAAHKNIIGMYTQKTSWQCMQIASCSVCVYSHSERSTFEIVSSGFRGYTVIRAKEVPS